MKKFLVRLTHWEYWPFSVVYFPVYFYYLWLSFKHRSFFFFTAANPSIEFGGMFGERKSEIFKILPKEYIPKTYLVPKGDLDNAIVFGDQVGYPLIVKPDIGERGIWVEKINKQEELSHYVSICPVDFLIQEFVDSPMELGLFFVRKPGEEKGEVTSIVRKDFLALVGDGKRTLIELLNNNTRAQLTANLKATIGSENRELVLKPGEKIILEPIGNHCRGTQFLNDNLKINNKLNEAFNELTSQIPDFYFGRFDIRCKSYEDLANLKHFKILELNGAGSEPGHIYQPGYPLIKAYKDILWHLRVLADISAQNKKRGIHYWTFRAGLRKWLNHRKYNKVLVQK